MQMVVETLMKKKRTHLFQAVQQHPLCPPRPRIADYPAHILPPDTTIYEKSSGLRVGEKRAFVRSSREGRGTEVTFGIDLTARIC